MTSSYNWVPRTAFFTIGDGIDVSASLVKGSSEQGPGLGAFVTRPVKNGDIITVYDGQLVHCDELPRFDMEKVRVCSMLCVSLTNTLLQMKNPLLSHVMRIRDSDYAVVGLAVPTIGRGAGQFINHGSRDVANCKCKHIVPATNVPGNIVWRYIGDKDEFANSQSPYIVVVATEDIDADRELLWTYPRQSIARFRINAGFEPPSDDDSSESDIIDLDNVDVDVSDPETLAKVKEEPPEAAGQVVSEPPAAVQMDSDAVPRTVGQKRPSPDTPNSPQADDPSNTRVQME